MSSNPLRTNRARVSDVLAQVEERPLPLVRDDAVLDEVIAAMIASPRTRLLYVVDADERLVGAISLGALVRHVFSHSHAPRVHARSLIDMISSETAAHLMRPKPISATPDELVGDVVKRLVQANVKEFPVLDAEGRIVADLTMVDLLAFLVEEEEESAPPAD